MAAKKQLTEKERNQQQAEELPERKAMSVLGIGDELDIDADVILADDDGGEAQGESAVGEDVTAIGADITSDDESDSLDVDADVISRG